MNDLKYKYFIIEGISESDIVIIDRVRKVIHSIKNGMYVDETKEIQKIYEKDKKADFMKGYVGSNYLRTLVDGESRHLGFNKILLKTNDRRKFDMECMKIRKEQTEHRLKCIKREWDKLLKEDQYYTYTFSDLDYVIGNDKIDDKYFQNRYTTENTLDEILKPKPYEEKEVEVTILDENYDLGTTFYYIEEPKDDYEKFIKYLSENVIVKEIWKDETLIVGLNDFVKSHIKEFNHLFGNQMEDIYIENIIKMIDGNATESCYTDFKKTFKTDYNFMFCNNHTFEEIKEATIGDLDYEKAHDLAIIENREALVSAYLGVYDNKFQVTFSIHSQTDFDNNFMNLRAVADIINMKDINNKEELENLMKSMLNDFYNNSSENIEILSKRLDENENNVIQEETEEMEE